jgi:hypothetical protein
LLHHPTRLGLIRPTKRATRLANSRKKNNNGHN